MNNNVSHSPISQKRFLDRFVKIKKRNKPVLGTGSTGAASSMSLIDDVLGLVADVMTLRIYQVTVIVERDGILIGKKEYKQLMTLKRAERMIR